MFIKGKNKSTRKLEHRQAQPMEFVIACEDFSFRKLISFDLDEGCKKSVVKSFLIAVDKSENTDKSYFNTIPLSSVSNHH